MKTINIKIAVTLIMSAIIVTSCKKESEDHNIASKSIKKTTINQLKDYEEFPEDYWDDLTFFTNSLIQGSELDNSMEINKALYYIESALDYRLTNISENGVQYRLSREGAFSFAFMVGNTELNAGEIMQIDAEAYQQITDEAESLSISEGDTIRIEAIDLEWEINYAIGEIEVSYTVLYAVGGASYLAPICTLPERKMGIREGCNGNSKPNNAIELIDSYTRPLACGYWRDALSCSNNQNGTFKVKTSQSFINRHSPNCNSFLNELTGWCITSSSMTSEFEGIKYYWNSRCTDITNRNEQLFTVEVYPDFLQNGNIALGAKYWAGKCIDRGAEGYHESRPMPAWNGGVLL